MLEIEMTLLKEKQQQIGRMYFKGQLAVPSIIFRMWNAIVCEYGKQRSVLKMKLENDNFQVM